MFAIASFYKSEGRTEDPDYKGSYWKPDELDGVVEKFKPHSGRMKVNSGHSDKGSGVLYNVWREGNALTELIRINPVTPEGQKFIKKLLNQEPVAVSMETNLKYDKSTNSFVEKDLTGMALVDKPDQYDAYITTFGKDKTKLLRDHFKNVSDLNDITADEEIQQHISKVSEEETKQEQEAKPAKNVDDDDGEEKEEKENQDKNPKAARQVLDDEDKESETDKLDNSKETGEDNTMTPQKQGEEERSPASDKTQEKKSKSPSSPVPTSQARKETSEQKKQEKTETRGNEQSTSLNTQSQEIKTTKSADPMPSQSQHEVFVGVSSANGSKQETNSGVNESGQKSHPYFHSSTSSSKERHAMENENQAKNGDANSDKQNYDGQERGTKRESEAMDTDGENQAPRKKARQEKDRYDLNTSDHAEGLESLSKSLKEIAELENLDEQEALEHFRNDLQRRKQKAKQEYENTLEHIRNFFKESETPEDVIEQNVEAARNDKNVYAAYQHMLAASGRAKANSQRKIEDLHKHGNLQNMDDQSPDDVQHDADRHTGNSDRGNGESHREEMKGMSSARLQSRTLPRSSLQQSASRMYRNTFMKKSAFPDKHIGSSSSSNNSNSAKTNKSRQNQNNDRMDVATSEKGEEELEDQGFFSRLKHSRRLDVGIVTDSMRKSGMDVNPQDFIPDRPDIDAADFKKASESDNLLQRFFHEFSKPLAKNDVDVVAWRSGTPAKI